MQIAQEINKWIDNNKHFKSPTSVQESIDDFLTRALKY